MLLVRVVVVSMLSGEQMDLGSWPRIYEHHEEGKDVELYAMDLNGTICTLAVRGPGGGWVPTNGARGEEYFAKFYGAEGGARECPR